ncbi:MAG: putative membrane protein [Planctomycetota bacterium]|jgi:uncharacterized membrane protein
MSPQASPSTRLPALDWMRGLVMVLMTLDHASHVFNGAAVSQDSYLFWANGADLTPSGTPWAFLTRWITHLCAPTFLFLAGISAALAIASRQAKGLSEERISAYLASRGGLLILLELWMWIAWPAQVLQVLYAIGVSFLALSVLRFLPIWSTVALALLWIVAGEACVVALGLRPEGLGFQPPAPGWAALSIVPRFDQLTHGPTWMGVELLGIRMLNYPFATWLAILLLGHAFGRWLVAERQSSNLPARAGRFLMLAGGACLVAFLLLRGFSNYGNFWLERTDASLLRWLQVSKYPASLAFVLLELGIAGLILGGMFLLQQRWTRGGDRGLFTVLGQSALAYYLVHAHALRFVAYMFFDIAPTDAAPFGVASGWIAGAVCVLVLWPACLGWRTLKRRRRAAQAAR